MHNPKRFTTKSLVFNSFMEYCDVQKSRTLVGVGVGCVYLFCCIYQQPQFPKEERVGLGVMSSVGFFPICVIKVTVYKVTERELHPSA